MNQDHLAELESRIRTHIQHDIQFLREDAEVEPWNDDQIKNFMDSHQAQIRLIMDTIISEYETLEIFFQEVTPEEMNEFISEHITYPNPE